MDTLLSDLLFRLLLFWQSIKMKSTHQYKTEMNVYLFFNLVAQIKPRHPSPLTGRYGIGCNFGAIANDSVRLLRMTLYLSTAKIADLPGFLLMFPASHNYGPSRILPHVESSIFHEWSRIEVYPTHLPTWTEQNKRKANPLAHRPPIRLFANN